MALDQGQSEAAAAAPSSRQAHYLLLGIDLRGTLCVIVGGGRVGSRKAATLLDGGASVTVVSPEICARLADPVREGRVLWKQQSYDSSCLEGAGLVVAATSDPALNVRIGGDAEARGLLCCVASSAGRSRVIFPAVAADAQVTVAVHTHGRDCRLSRSTRDEIAVWLEGRRKTRHQLAVFGVYRDEVDPAAFEKLAEAGPVVTRNAFPDHEMLVLSTCRRWECYVWHPVQCATATALRAVLGLAVGSFSPTVGFAKAGARAHHHLLRVATGLDSTLIGETDVVGQMRTAVKGSNLDERRGLGGILARALTAQKRVRNDSGLAAHSVGWAEAVARQARARLGALAGRSVLLVGCGRLGQAIARRLIPEGMRVIPFSRRAAREPIPWCTESALHPRPPDALAELLPEADAVVLTSSPPVVLEALLSGGAGPATVVIDLTGEAPPECPPLLDRVSLAEVGRVPLTGAAVARISAAERLAIIHVLRQQALSLQPDLNRRIRIASRGSLLARAQVREVGDYLTTLFGEPVLDVVAMETPGDRDRKTPLLSVTQDDFFTRDLDQALLRGEVDLTVHSAKDLPARVPEGLCVAAVTPTLAPWECLVSREGVSLESLSPGARVGTSSERRRSRLLELRPDLCEADIRGNVPDRLAQLDRGEFDALLLAAVGLVRLGLEGRISEVFSLERFPWSPGQGSLALMIREDDEELAELLRPLDLGARRGMPWA